MSLPWSLEIVATDISKGDDGGARAEVGVVGGTTMNGSRGELGGLMVGGAGW